jgi:pimeloyl-ACP methyl ester carboxylesterase
MAELSYRKKGSGKPVILLHGFPFNQEIWEDFSHKLAQSFLVYTVDLPGFGESPSLNPPFSIDDVAARILGWIDIMKINNSVVIGHSLGGYIALAMVKKAPDLFAKLCLFHSTAYADTEEKKQSRNKVLEFVDKNGAAAFTSNFITPLFSNQTHLSISKVRTISMSSSAEQTHLSISKVRTISMSSSAEAVKGYTVAMRDRPDQTNVLKTFNKPVLFIAGSNDQGIPVDSIHKQAALSLYSETVVLSNVAHMGMFESENQCIETISSFIKGNSVTK